jgi:signal transduction histidine kinase
MALCAGAGIAFGLLGEWAFAQTGAGLADLARDLAVGWIYIAVGLWSRWRRPESRVGWIMVAEGLSWYLGNLQGVTIPVLVAIGSWLEGLNMAILGHLVLAMPSGRVRSTPRRLVVFAAYGVVAIGGLARTLAYDPGAQPDATYLACRACTDNMVFVPSLAPLFPAVDIAYKAAGAVLALVIAAMLVRRWAGTPRPNRHGALTVWSLAALVAALTVAGLQAFGGGRHEGMLASLPWLTDLIQVGIPVSFVLAPLQRQLASAAVADLVIEVGRMPAPSRLRDALARALRDPWLELGFWIPDRRCYVGSDGRPLDLRALDAGRIATYLERSGRPLAVMIHDRALAEERNLMDAARAAAQLGLENERLQAQVRAQLEEVRASRVRLVEVASAERQRLERDLHDGAQQRLVSVLMNLVSQRQQTGQGAAGAPPDGLDQAIDELRLALSDLRELANGIHPALLTQGGLAPAIASLAERAPLPVEVAIPSVRHPALVEVTAYFIVCEALANAAKHSGASAVRVTAGRRGDRLTLEVADDGVGGADPSRGSGLVGVQDRAAALGGSVRVDSPPGGGTAVLIELPCG